MLREKFLQVYANLPLSVRKEIILVLEENGNKQPITWQVAYLEVKNDTGKSKEILERLEKLKII